MIVSRRSINKTGVNEYLLVLCISLHSQLYSNIRNFPSLLDQASSSHPFPNTNNFTVKMMKTDLYNVTNRVIKGK